MKRIISIFIFTTFSFTSFSQIVLRLSSLKFTEDFGQLFKPPIGAEIGCAIFELEDRFQYGGSIGYFRTQAKAEEFLGYGVLGFSSNASVRPTKNVYKNFELIPIVIGGSFKILDKPLTPIVSLGVMAYLGKFDLKTEGGLINIEGNVALEGVGMKPEIGLAYTYKALVQFQLSIAKSLTLPSKGEKLQYWQIGLSSQFYL